MQEVLIGDIMQSSLENLVSWHCHLSCMMIALLNVSPKDKGSDVDKIMQFCNK